MVTAEAELPEKEIKKKI